MTFIAYVLKRYLCTEYFIKVYSILTSSPLIKTVRLQCVQPTLPKYFSALECLFFPFNCHVTGLNLFNDRNCDVFAKLVRSAVVEKAF